MQAASTSCTKAVTGPAKKASIWSSSSTSADRCLGVFEHEDGLETTSDEDSHEPVESGQTLTGKPVGMQLLAQRAQLGMDVGRDRPSTELGAELRRRGVATDLVRACSFKSFALTGLELQRSQCSGQRQRREHAHARGIVSADDRDAQCDVRFGQSRADRRDEAGLPAADGAADGDGDVLLDERSGSYRLVGRPRSELVEGDVVVNELGEL